MRTRALMTLERSGASKFSDSPSTLGNVVVTPAAAPRRVMLLGTMMLCCHRSTPFGLFVASRPTSLHARLSSSVLRGGAKPSLMLP